MKEPTRLSPMSLQGIIKTKFQNIKVKRCLKLLRCAHTHNARHWLLGESLGAERQWARLEILKASDSQPRIIKLGKCESIIETFSKIKGV
jgi:hypothetical protein